MTRVTDEMVEAGAKATYEHWQNIPACIASKSWDENCEKLPGSAKFFRDLSRTALEAALASNPAEAVEPVKEIDASNFDEWSLADFAAQCLMQSREQLDPEFSRFMSALGKRLADTVPIDAFKAIEGESNQLRKLCTMNRNDASRLREVLREYVCDCTGQCKAEVYGGSCGRAAYAALEVTHQEQPIPLFTHPPTPKGLEEAMEVIRPFAARADRYDDIPGVSIIHDNVELWQLQRNKGMQPDITVGDLRRARSFIKEGGK